MRKVRTAVAALLTLALGGCLQSALPPIRQDAAVVPPDLIFTADDGAHLPVRVWRPAGGLPARATILATTYAVVVFAVVVQGLSFAPLVSTLKRGPGPAEDATA